MAFELIYTSTPRGLVPGSYGFCVVARSRAMSERVAVVLKELSGYRRIAGATPVAYSHFVFDDGGRGVRAIARIADAGLDYSNRTNQIAHFITLDGNDLVPCGPAELCAANPPLFQRRWDAPPQWFEAPTPVHNRVEPRFQSSEWQNLLGDLGWAGALASTVKTGQSVAIVARPEQNVLRLFQESIYLLDPSQRWKATFSTYYTKAPGNVLIQWKTVFAGTPEEAAFRATPNCLLIDLANPSRVGAPERFHGSPECARLVERARRELLRAPEPVASPGAIPNLATAGAANAYDVGPTPIYGQSSSPGQPDFRGLNPQDQGVYAVRQPVPSQGAPSVPRKGGKKVLNYGRPAPGTQGPSITPRREKKDGTKSLIWALVGAIVALTLALVIVLAIKSDVSDLVKWTKNWFAHSQEITETAAPDAGNKSAAETVKNAANAAKSAPDSKPSLLEVEGENAESGAEEQSTPGDRNTGENDSSVSQNGDNGQGENVDSASTEPDSAGVTTNKGDGKQNGDDNGNERHGNGNVISNGNEVADTQDDQATPESLQSGNGMENVNPNNENPNNSIAEDAQVEDPGSADNQSQASIDSLKASNQIKEISSQKSFGFKYYDPENGELVASDFVVSKKNQNSVKALVFDIKTYYNGKEYVLGKYRDDCSNENTKAFELKSVKDNDEPNLKDVFLLVQASVSKSKGTAEINNDNGILFIKCSEKELKDIVKGNGSNRGVNAIKNGEKKNYNTNDQLDWSCQIYIDNDLKKHNEGNKSFKWNNDSQLIEKQSFRRATFYKTKGSQKKNNEAQN